MFTLLNKGPHARTQGNQYIKGDFAKEIPKRSFKLFYVNSEIFFFLIFGLHFLDAIIVQVFWMMWAGTWLFGTHRTLKTEERNATFTWVGRKIRLHFERIWINLKGRRIIGIENSVVYVSDLGPELVHKIFIQLGEKDRKSGLTLLWHIESVVACNSHP